MVSSDYFFQTTAKTMLKVHNIIKKSTVRINVFLFAKGIVLIISYAF